MNDFTGSIGKNSSSSQHPNVEANDATTQPSNVQTYEKANVNPNPYSCIP